MNSSTTRDGSHSAQDDASLTKASSPKSKTAESSTPQTRVACDACRDRKIRCNRNRPTCGRCTKLGIACRYSVRSTSTPSKMDLTRILMTMNNRLQHAEAQLASNSVAPNPQSLQMSWGPEIGPPSTSNPPTHSATSSTDLFDLGMICEIMPVTQAVTECSDPANINYLDFEFDNFTSEISIDQIDYDGNQAMYSDIILTNTLPSSPYDTGSELSNGLMQRLRDISFDIYRPMLMMVDRVRFEAELSQPSPPIQVQALSYAIGALGAFTVPELHCHVKKCYQQSRTLLDQCERQESAESLTSINTVQACTLLTIYELKHPNFGRAWMSLGRAIRLAKMMGLDQVDDQASIAAQWYPSTQTVPLFSPAEVEERRRTFWVLYTIDAFASTSTMSGLSFNDQIFVSLPGPEPIIQDFVETGLKMQSLSEIFDSEISEKTRLSSFAGVAMMVYMYQQCTNHMRSSSHQQSYNFWEAHYGINKAIDLCRTSLLVEHLNGNSSDDPESLALRVSVDAVEILLHECALLKIQKNELPSVLATDAISRCTLAVTDIVDSLQMCQRMTGRKRELFQQLSNFHAWPIVTAIQVCCRILHHGCVNVIPYIDAVRTLSNARTTKALIEQQLIDPGLLEKANAVVAAAEQSIAMNQI